MNYWWVVTFASLIGVVLNIYHSKYGFAIWTFTNFLWIIRTYNLMAYEQAFLFTIYFFLAIWGYLKWENQ